ncbi:UrcA family protein [Hyphobacterium marinum]|uniref:UrcA family protein n=1 Tax=Hyphobacterium marinum TaxID=3116574 RepID=A0ABU7LW23_9PROT|nr:UrcA family protein [Hyphobacterium sp. Y6023]MEE2565681.1 UrcA family protein [Hyphobacterium sp. Y6023]
MLNVLLPALLLATNPIEGVAPQADFTFDRAELATIDGAAAVHARLVNVATSVCEIENANGAMAQRGIRTCVADTVARAVAEIDAPALSEIHAGRLVSPDERPAMVQVAARD